jgi:hypothetical protein
LDKTVLLEIFWKVLEPQGISKSAYHGGNMEGNQIHKFANLSYKVWPEICSLLESVPINKRAHKKCTDDLIENVCTAFEYLMGYYDTMISIVCSPMGTLTDEQISDVEKVSDFESVHPSHISITLRGFPKPWVVHSNIKFTLLSKKYQNLLNQTNSTGLTKLAA